MRIVRSFSTSLGRARQALYEPYVAPLNQEQKKALRKVMAKSAPKFHGRLSKDLATLVKSYGPAESTLIRRRLTIQRVEEIVKSAFGPEYSVLDRSMYTYARDLEIAPLELAIHDSSRPRGFPPGTEGQFLPDPYNHEVLAVLLQKYGYTGCFVAGDAERTLPPETREDRLPQAIEVRGPLPVNPPWPSFTPRPSAYLTYPPVLYAEHTSGETLSFFLSPPLPTYVPLVHLLHAYCSMNESFAELVSIIFLWVRSIDLPQMTPTCVALMVIGFLQNQNSIPSLQNPQNSEDIRKLAELNEGVWIRAEFPPRHLPKAFWFETAFMPPQSQVGDMSRPKKMGRMLFNFFNFWSQEGASSNFISSDQCLSVREGVAIPRIPVVKNTRSVLIRDQAKDRNLHRGDEPWTPTNEPIIWQTQPLVIPDPFIPSYNHAQSISKSSATYFHYFNSLSHRTIFRSHPMSAIFGPSVPAPSRSMGRPTRAYSTEVVGRDAKRIYESMLPPAPILDARARTISRVQTVIKNMFGNDYTIECFGSTRYGVSSATSDLDLVIIDPKRTDGFSPNVRVARLPDVYDTKVVARTLAKKGFTKVFAIPKATVPIVKFCDPTTGLDCDLNTNDQLGLWNTLLIKQYCDLSPDLVRPMIFTIKRWAKSHGLNDPSGRNGPVTFSSYALVLMVIGYLQVRGVLPNLQAQLQPLSTNTKKGIFWIRAKKGDPIRCDTRSSVEEGWKSEVQIELGEALAGWFTFWAKDYNYDEQLLDIRGGGLIKRSKKQPRKKKPKKKTKTKAIPLHQLQEDVREHEEDAALAAWQSQDESEGEDLDPEREEIEVIDVSAENEDTDDVVTQGQRAAGGTDDKHDESLDHSTADVPPAAEVGFSPPESEAETQSDGSSELQADTQPSQWRTHALVVADPFILAKNVCGNINKPNVERLQKECHRSAQLIELGADLEDLIGNGDSVPGPPRRGRGGRRGIAMDRGATGGKGRGGTGTKNTEPGRSSGQTDGDSWRGRGRQPGGFPGRGSRAPERPLTMQLTVLAPQSGVIDQAHPH